MTEPTRQDAPRKDAPPGGRLTLRGVLLFLAALLWLIMPILVFYIFHKPFPAETWERLRDAAIDLLVAGWILWIGTGVGLRFFRGAGFPAFERAALSGALGLGILGLLSLGAAATGGLTRPATVIFCAAATVIVSMPLVRGIMASAGRLPRQLFSGGVFSIFTGFFAAVSLGLSLGIALAPPVAWDALVYHFRIPQQILAAGSPALPGDSLFGEMPHLGEMLYALAIVITGRAETAAVLGWGIALLALVGITGIARRMGLRHVLLPAALILSGDTLARSMGWGYVDWISGLFGFAVLSALSQRDRGMKWIFTAGVFAGFAFGTKYTAGVILAVALLAVLSPRQGRRSVKEAAVILAGFLLAFSPWILRGLFLWGNPLPPLLDTGQLAEWKRDFFTGRSLEYAGLAAAVMPLLQSTVGAYGKWPFGVTIGPLLIALIPGALARRSGDEPGGRLLLRLCWLSALLFWAVCGAGAFLSVSLTQPRLYMALIPGIALLSAYGFEGLWKVRLSSIRLGALAAVLSVLVMTFQVLGFASDWIESRIPGYLSGLVTRQEYLEGALGWHARAMEGVRSLPDGSRVVMLWEPRGFYCGEVCLEDSNIDRWYLAMREGSTAEEILAEWRAEGWTHVLFFDSGADFERRERSEYAASDWSELDRLLALLPVAQRFGVPGQDGGWNGYTLYSLE